MPRPGGFSQQLRPSLKQISVVMELLNLVPVCGPLFDELVNQKIDSYQRSDCAKPKNTSDRKADTPNPIENHVTIPRCNRRTNAHAYERERKWDHEQIV